MKKCMICFLIFALFLSGCDIGSTRSEYVPTDQTQQKGTLVLPENVIQIGDSFEFYPGKADGHFICTVTDVRVVTEQSECPVIDSSLWGYVDGEEVLYQYEEWFVTGGAFDRGARIILADITVTNVDAVAWLDNGTFNEDCGWFNDPYAFYAFDFIEIADLTSFDGAGYSGPCSVYFSREGEYREENDPSTIGVETSAIQILPGQTVSYTLGFPVHGEKGGVSADLSAQWLCVGVDKNVNTGIFIDTALGDE